jgi:hypothetical protein
MKASVYDVTSACISAAAYSADNVSKSQIQKKVTLLLTVIQYVCWCQPSAAGDYSLFRILSTIVRVCQS